MSLARALVVGFVLMMPGCASSPKLPPPSPEIIAQRATVWIDTPRTTCSGTVMSPGNVILTAAHCLQGEPVILQISGPAIPLMPVTTVSALVDTDRDTAWVTIEETFPHFAQLGLPPKQRDDVFMFGNPGGSRDLYRRGYVMGMDGARTIFDLPISHGDSGAAIFNTRGEVVALVQSYDLYSSGILVATSMPIWRPVTK